MNEFAGHIRILMLFCIGLLVAFIIAFTMDNLRLWLSTLASASIAVFVIAILARSNDETGKTD